MHETSSHEFAALLEIANPWSRIFTMATVTIAVTLAVQTMAVNILKSPRLTMRHAPVATIP